MIQPALRTEVWAGEARVNLIRLIALAAYYAQHLVATYAHRADPAWTPQYHAAVTAVVLTWAAGIGGLHIALTRRWLPSWLPFASALGDVALVTALLMASGGVRSPLVVLYWLVVASTPLRLSLRLVVATTVASMLGYLATLGVYAHGVVGATAYYADAALRVPRSQQVVALLGLFVAGLLAAQSVRQARRLVAGGDA
ncbi:MAG: hypothetical protein U0746_05505 [Gemmataceae bacterium]